MSIADKINVTIDTSILCKIDGEEVSWNQVLDGFINNSPIRGWVTSAALQEFCKKQPLPERLQRLDHLSSRRAGYGSGLYGQGLYGGTTVNQAGVASALYTVGISEIGTGDCIGSEEDNASLEKILGILTNGSYKGWDWNNLSRGQIRNYRDAQAFEAHVRLEHSIFLTDDSDFDKLKPEYQTTIISLKEFLHLTNIKEIHALHAS